MIDLIESNLFCQGFIKPRDNYYYVNNNENIYIYLNEDRYTASIISGKMCINIDCEFDQIFDILDKINQDPLKYQKHLIRNFMDCMDYFDEHYDKELRDLGFTRVPIFERLSHIDNSGMDNHRIKFGIEYRYSFYDRINFYYHPGIESIISYLNYEENDYIDFINTKEKELIKKKLKYCPKFTHLVEGTKDRYLEFEKYKESLREGYDDKILKVEEFCKKYPLEWLEEIKCCVRKITII